MPEQMPNMVAETMRKLCEALQVRLPNTVEAVYVYGSTALGAYVEGSSDIDFIVVVDRPLSASDRERIAQAHADVELALPGSDIMGAYIQRKDLGKTGAELAPIPTYYNKRLWYEGYGDLNVIAWWILQRHGICVYGRELEFDYVIAEEELVRFVIRNMNAYWAGWIGKLEGLLNAQELSGDPMPPEQLDYAVECCTLGMLRQYYSIRERGVTSKIGAGEYGFDVLPERWHSLIREAIAIKRLRPDREYAAPWKRLYDLVQLLRLIHTESNRLALSAPSEAGIAPWLSVRHAGEALAYYKAAFRASELYRLDDDGRVAVAQLSIGGSDFWIQHEPESGPKAEGPGAVRMILTVEDPDQAFEQAVAAGAKVVFPVGEGHGWRIGRLEDPFGHHWEVGKRLS